MAELIGFPWTIVVGKRHVKGGPLEVRDFLPSQEPRPPPSPSPRLNLYSRQVHHRALQRKDDLSLNQFRSVVSSALASSRQH